MAGILSGAQLAAQLSVQLPAQLAAQLSARPSAQLSAQLAAQQSAAQQSSAKLAAQPVTQSDGIQVIAVPVQPCEYLGCITQARFGPVGAPSRRCGLHRRSTDAYRAQGHASSLITLLDHSSDPDDLPSARIDAASIDESLEITARLGFDELGDLLLAESQKAVRQWRATARAQAAAIFAQRCKDPAWSLTAKARNGICQVAAANLRASLRDAKEARLVKIRAARSVARALREAQKTAMRERHLADRPKSQALRPQKRKSCAVRYCRIPPTGISSGGPPTPYCVAHRPEEAAPLWGACVAS